MKMRNILLSIAPSLLLGVALTATAAQSNHPAFDLDKEIPERKVQTLMGERSYKRLEAIHELIGNGEMAQAEERLHGYIDSVEGNPYETALGYQNLGYVYVQQEDYRKALGPLKRAVEMDALPEGPQQETIMLIAQMYAAEDDWPNTIQWLDRWFTRTNDPSPDSLILSAQARAQMERYREAIPFVKFAIERKDDPQESWYQLWLAMHFELREYSQAADVLEIMINKWSNKPTYWEQLAGIYQELGDDRRALATQMLAYRKGLFGSQEKILNLVRFYLFMEVPYKAAQILQEEIDRGRVEKNLKHYELLADAWSAARETEEAIVAHEMAARYDDDGSHWLTIAQLHNDKGNWRETIAAVSEGLDKGLEEPGDAYLLQGRAAAELKEYDEAIRYFRKALSYEDSRDQARAWISYAEDELNVSA